MELEDQRQFWNRWNAQTRALHVNDVSRRQADIITGWLQGLGRRNLNILEVGCGAAWFTPELSTFGSVTATDLSDELLARAQIKQPSIRFVAGDFMELDFGRVNFDVAITLEVLSHVSDQAAFIGKIADSLRPGGYLMLATQNKPILQRYNRIPPPERGQIRRWVDKKELSALLAPHFDVVKINAASPIGSHGLMAVLTQSTLNKLMRLLTGKAYQRLLEHCGFGFTPIALARKR